MIFDSLLLLKYSTCKEKFTKNWKLWKKIGSLKTKTFENGFHSARFWKQYCYCLCVNYENANLWTQWHSITCSDYRNAYVGRRTMFFTKWHRQLLVWHRTAFLIVFANPCERGMFWQRCLLYVKLSKMQRKNFSVFSCCVNIPLENHKMY